MAPLRDDPVRASEQSMVSLLRYILSIFLPLLIHRHAQFLQVEDFTASFNSIASPLPETFDFIIVGGGSAGAVVANRLSAHPNKYQVLLLEAGGSPNFITMLPGLDVVAPNHPDVDYMYRSVPAENYCLSCYSQRAAVTRGKGLGGSSNLNFMIYNRGNPKDFDEWAHLVGDPSWKYEHVLEYFKKSENYFGNYPNPRVHGCGGELYVSKSPYAPGLGRFERALEDHGIPNQDINANQTNAFMKLDQTTWEGYRWSSYRAFLHSILNRPNLHVYRYSFVTGLLFDPRNKTRVIGVQYNRQNITLSKIAMARKEVILSAGAYDSPKLLMLSGIGPKEDLQVLRIPLRKDLRVGRNYQDHPTTMFPIVFNKTDESLLYERDLSLNFEGKDGTKVTSLFSALGGTGILATGYTSTKYNDDVTRPDIQSFIAYMGMSRLSSEVFGPLFNIPPRLFDHYLGPVQGFDGNMVLVTLMRSQSVGWVQLNGTNPYNAPVINPNFFTDDLNEDMKRLVEGMKFMVNFYEKSEAYSEVGAHLLPNKWPGCEKHVFKSDDYFECYIRHVTFTLWHPSGTCKMGRRDDPMAVVDSRLRVIGVEGLRVIDNSIMPKITNGNTNSPAIMIGEKGAAMIIEDNGGGKIAVGSQKPCPHPPIASYPRENEKEKKSNKN